MLSVTERGFPVPLGFGGSLCMPPGPGAAPSGEGVCAQKTEIPYRSLPHQSASGFHTPTPSTALADRPAFWQGLT